VDVGNLVQVGATLLTTIVSVEPMYVYFDVDERALIRYRRDYSKNNKDPDAKEPPLRDLKIPIDVGLEGEEGFSQKGYIDFADNKVNASTGTIRLRGILPNKQNVLVAGMRARVRVPVNDPYKALLIPERAVGSDQGRKFVYIVNSQDVVERRYVELDRSYDGMQVVRDGLKPDNWVIVNGIQRVRDGQKVQPHRVPEPKAAEQAPKPSSN
jgi:RND family efflux transporter MFP subunit